jgi:hypothetical protein
VYGKSKDKTESKQLKQKELKTQKQNKEKYFQIYKDEKKSQWCNLPKYRKLQGAERSLTAPGIVSRLWKLQVWTLSFVPQQRHQKVALMTLRKCANSLGLQV